MERKRGGHVALTRSEIMSKVRSRDSRQEIALRRRLWSIGLRFRKNDRTVFGCPDIVFKGKRVAIFVDGEFWHGKDYPNGRRIPKTNREYWTNKIETNIRRDQEVNEVLRRDGWTVLRFWSMAVKDDLEGCVDVIVDVVNGELRR